MGLTSCRRVTIAKMLAHRRRECAIGIMRPCRVAVERAADRYTRICDGPYMFAGPPFGEEADDVDAIAAGDGKDAIEA
jgi:hypothetical protein